MTRLADSIPLCAWGDHEQMGQRSGSGEARGGKEEEEREGERKRRWNGERKVKKVERKE